MRLELRNMLRQADSEKGEEDEEADCEQGEEDVESDSEKVRRMLRPIVRRVMRKMERQNVRRVMRSMGMQTRTSSCPRAGRLSIGSL